MESTVRPLRCRTTRLRAAVAALSLLALSGCVAANSLQTQNTASALTPPDDVTIVEGENIDGESLAEDAPPVDGLAETANEAEETSVATALAPTTETSPSAASTDLLKTAEPEAKAAKAQLEKPKPVNPLAAFFAPKRATPQTKRKRTQVAKVSTSRSTAGLDRTERRSTASGSLPGVRSREGLFGIITRTNERNGSDTRNKNNRNQLASAGALAGVGRQIFQHQRKGIRSDCFPRALVNILRQVERHYGKRLVITSGYRSRSYNRRIRGARNSTHTRCMAADIQVKGVSKWALAKYLRSIPGRGGVGTYCWTKSVHIDVGAKRAWHYCNRRGNRRKKRRA